MRTNVILSAAVAAALAGGSASAATVDVYVSGSSALQNFFSADLGVNICGYTASTYKANLATASYLDSSYTFYAPSYTQYQCTAQATITGVVTAGDVVNLHYAAELGSTWGIYESYAGSSSTRAHLTASAAGCPAGSYTVPGKVATQAGAVWPTSGSTSYCTATGFSHVTDAATTDPNGVLTQHNADVVVSDIEPALFSSSDDWPTANLDPALQPTTLATPPTAPQLVTARGKMAQMNGQVFSVIANGLPGVANTVTNFSISAGSLRSILDGNYTQWKQVPEFASLDTTGTPINICRRDHGSGTELSASITFAGQECSLDGAAQVQSASVTSYVSAPRPFVYEGPATADIKSCVTSAPGTIGIIVNANKDSNFSYAILLVDGYQPNAHNAAAGLYRYAYENWAGATGFSANAETVAIANLLLSDAKSFSKLSGDAFANETGALSASGQWIGTSVNAVYAPGSAANARTAVQWATDPLPAAMFSRAGDSCALRNNGNN